MEYNEERVVNWITNNQHLPVFIRTQEQKDLLFNFVAYAYINMDTDGNLFSNKSNWPILQTYIFDYFLSTLAVHGYVLRKINHKVKANFLDLEQSIASLKQLMEDNSKKELIEKVWVTEYDKKIDNYRKPYSFLPEFLKDFHDQKFFFKMIHEYGTNDVSENDVLNGIPFQHGQVMIVDYFLYILAKYGYKIQHYNQDIGFKSIYESVSAYEKQIDAMQSASLNNLFSKK